VLKVSHIPVDRSNSPYIVLLSQDGSNGQIVLASCSVSINTGGR
jgi:hypothetical protein